MDGSREPPSRTLVTHQEDRPSRPRAEGLIYHAGGLGDFVLSLPAMQRVRQAFPGLLWRFWGPADRLRLLPGCLPPLPGLVKEGHTLWGGAPSAGALSALARAEVVLAFGGRTPPAWIRHARGRILGIASFPPAGGGRVTAYQKAQLDRLGIPRVAERWLPRWRREALPYREPRRIVLHPGSGSPLKNLPPQTWIRVLEVLRRETGLGAELVAGPAEAERGGLGPLREAAEGFTPCAGLGDFLRVLARAALYLGNDAGPTHLAALLGVPVVAVFGPTDPGLWGPRGPWVVVVRTGAECAPCTPGGPVPCAQPECLADLDPDAVSRAALALWEKVKGNGHRADRV